MVWLRGRSGSGRLRLGKEKLGLGKVRFRLGTVGVVRVTVLSMMRASFFMRSMCCS